jgi:hypothetical protein
VPEAIDADTLAPDASVPFISHDGILQLLNGAVSANDKPRLAIG